MMKRRIGLGVMATLAIVAVAVPAADREESTSDAFSRLLSPARDLNAPLDVNARIGDASKATVLIYYANETAPNESEAKNYALLMDWLGSSKNAKIKEIAGSLASDLETFHVVVDEEIEAIRRHVAALESQRKVRVAVFTNRLARAGKYHILQPDTDGVIEAAIAVPKFDNLVYDANPLAHPELFARALESVGKRFDPQQHQFVLITKSHGGPDVALTPRVILDAAATGREQLLAMVEQDLASANAHRHTPEAVLNEAGEIEKASEIDKDDLLGKDTGTPMSKDRKLSGEKWEFPILEKASEILKEGTLSGDPPASAPQIGVRKADYAAILLRLGRDQEMTFPVVFVESCRSQLEDSTVQQLQSHDTNIGRLYTSDLTGLQYKTLDYDQVFRRVTGGADLADALNAELLAVYERQKAARAKEAQQDNESKQDGGSVDKDSASSVPVRDAHVQE